MHVYAEAMKYILGKLLLIMSKKEHTCMMFNVTVSHYVVLSLAISRIYDI